MASSLKSASATASDHSTVADATYGAGTSYDWANLGNAGASDNAYANAPGMTGDGNQTHRLDLKNWGFAIPSGATIDGIVATIEWRTSNNLRPLSELQIRLLKAGSPTGSNKATYSNSSTASDAVDSHGGSSDLWGATLSDTDVNATDFGICLQYRSDSSSSKNPFVDHVTLEVFYTESSGATGTFAATTRRNTLAASGTVNPITGTLAATTRRNTLAASGDVTSDEATGTFAATTRRATAAFAGIVDVVTGAFAAATRRNTLDAAGDVTSDEATGAFAATTRRAVLAASGMVNPITGAFAAVTRRAVMAFSEGAAPGAGARRLIRLRRWGKRRASGG